MSGIDNEAGRKATRRAVRCYRATRWDRAIPEPMRIRLHAPTHGTGASLAGDPIVEPGEPVAAAAVVGFKMPAGDRLGLTESERANWAAIRAERAADIRVLRQRETDAGKRPSIDMAADVALYRFLQALAAVYRPGDHVGVVDAARTADVTRAKSYLMIDHAKAMGLWEYRDGRKAGPLRGKAVNPWL